jgi:hypothetical protein
MSEAAGRACPKCSRPAATPGPRCLYCGAALPEAGAPPAGDAAAAPEPQPRALLVLDLAGAEAPSLARALGLRPFEAEQLVRRGGFHLHRIAEAEAIRSEQTLLLEAGLPVAVVPESEARIPPLLAIRGRYQAGELVARHSEGDLRLGATDVLMVVQGPISREYQPSREVKRVRTATLEPGFRFHLHRRSDRRPLELDPGTFEFGAGAREGSSLLTLSAWVRELAAGAPTDDRFRRLPPALGATSPEAGGALGAAAGLASGGGRHKDAPLILDNLAQFRFYSGWRAALQRQR